MMKVNKEKKTRWSDLFKSEGEMFEVPNHWRFLVEDEECLYYLEEGNLDLFITELVFCPPNLKEMAETNEIFTAEKLEGRLVFFKEMLKGDLFFSFSSDSGQTSHLLGRANGRCLIYKLKISKFITLLEASKELREGLSYELSSWFSSFTPFFTSYRQDYPSIIIEPDDLVEVPHEGALVPAHKLNVDDTVDVVWVTVTQGEFHPFGQANLTLGVNRELTYPLAPEMWLSTKGESSLESLTQGKVDYSSRFWRGLSAFHRHALVIFALYEAKIEREEAELAQQFREIDQSKLKKSISELEHILDKEHLYKQEKKDILYNTCMLVGRGLKLEFALPSEGAERLTIFDQLGQLCFDSHIFYRKVSLREGWFNEDLGPFLGFYGPELEPVALLPDPKSGYNMINLARNTSEVVTKEVDRKLALDACMFYRALPNKGSLTGKDLFVFAMHEKGRELSRAFWFGVVVNVLALFFPFAISVLFSTIIPYSELSLLAELTAGMIFVAAVSALFMYFRAAVVLRFEGLLAHDLTAAIWQRIFNHPIKFFQKYEVGDLILRAFSVETIRLQLVGPNLRSVINLIFSSFYLIPMFYYSPLLGSVALLIGSTGVFVSLWTMMKAIKVKQKIFDLQGKANSMVLQFLYGVSKIRIAGAENICFVLWEKIFHQIKKLQFPLEKLTCFTAVANYSIASISQLIIFVLGFYLAKGGEGSQISVGSFLAFMAAYMPFSAAINDFCVALLDISDVLPAWQRSQPIFQQAPEVDLTKSKPGELSGNIRFDHVSFRYDPEGPLILNDVSIKADPGEFIAVVGASGSGKTTLVRLLIGFENPEGGAVYYDNKDLNTLDIHEVRRQIGTVLQNSVVLSGTVRENVTTGGFYTDEEIWEAFKLSNFDEVCRKLPMGLETIVTNEGTAFSGGQRQRLIIARALVSKPKILIFDEATSALDNKTQEVVSVNLNHLNITRIVIAHRLSTIKNADRIYVFEKGKVIEEGSFDDLVENKGYFYNLLTKNQFS